MSKENFVKDKIIEVLKDSQDWEIKDISDNSNKRYSNREHSTIALKNSNLMVIVFSDGGYVVEKTNNQYRNELHDYIRREIRPKVRNFALKKLDEGVKNWNKWKQSNSRLEIDLSELELNKIDLSGINLTSVDLSDCKFEEVIFEKSDFRSSKLERSTFSKCDLRRCIFEYAQATGINLEGSDLSYSVLDDCKFYNGNLKKVKLEGASIKNTKFEYANLNSSILEGVILSSCYINEETDFKNASGIEIGLNGVYSPDNDTAALYASSPPGNSMKGPNAEAVIESLMRARKYFGFSFFLSLVAILIYYLDQDSTTLPFFSNFIIDNFQYLNIAMTFSVGFLVHTKSFLDDAFEGMKYLEDRSSVMRVGSFPWVLTKYSGQKIDQIIISNLSRLILCAHPIFYIVLVFDHSLGIYQKLVLSLIVLMNIWIFVFSTKFQTPILFDRQHELSKSNDTVLFELRDLKNNFEEFARHFKEYLDFLRNNEDSSNQSF